MATYWFGVTRIDSDLCGEEFLVEADNKKEANKIAQDIFCGETLTFYGKISEFQADMMGIDTY